MMANVSRLNYRTSVRELREKSTREFQVDDIAIERYYANKVTKLLLKKVSKRKSEEIVQRLLNSEDSVDSIVRSLGGSNEWRQGIKNASSEFRDLRSTTYLLISAPRTTGELSLQQDTESRKRQLDHFVNCMKKSSQLWDDKCNTVYVVSVTYENLMQHLEKFLLDDAARSRRAFVVFNGHGSTDGHLSFEEDTLKDITNTRFIADIYKLWSKHKQEHVWDGAQVILPQKITVVLAQCFGYVHTVGNEATEVIEVACLTNMNNPMTQFAYKLSNGSRRVSDAVHLELLNYARDLVKPVLKKDHDENESVTVNDNCPYAMTNFAYLRPTLYATTMAYLAFTRFGESISDKNKVNDELSVEFHLENVAMSNYLRSISEDECSVENNLSAFAAMATNIICPELSVTPAPKDQDANANGQTSMKEEVKSKKQRHKIKTQENKSAKKTNAMTSVLSGMAASALSLASLEVDASHEGTRKVAMTTKMEDSRKGYIRNERKSSSTTEALPRMLGSALAMAQAPIRGSND